MLTTNDEALARLMADVFGVDVAEITEDTSDENLENWDSMNQMRLVLAVEESFNVSFSADQLGRLVSYRLIRNALMQLGVSFVA